MKQNAANERSEEISSILIEITDFEQYLSLFEDVELPIVLDESFLTYNSIIKKSPIDTAIVSLFIKKNEELLQGVSLFDIYTFYPLVKFHVSPSVIGVIYADFGIAGGVEDRYILTLYSTSGEKTDEIIVGKEIGDCGLMSQATSVISQNEISLVETKFEGDCIEDTYREVSREEKQYEIDPEYGKITAL